MFSIAALANLYIYNLHKPYTGCASSIKVGLKTTPAKRSVHGRSRDRSKKSCQKCTALQD